MRMLDRCQSKQLVNVPAQNNCTSSLQKIGPYGLELIWYFGI